MKHVFSHNIDFETAKRAVDMAWESYKERLAKYRPSLEWVDDSMAKVGFKVGSIAFRCEILVGSTEFEVSASVPAIFRMFKKRAILVIEDDIRKWTAKAANSH